MKRVNLMPWKSVFSLILNIRGKDMLKSLLPLRWNMLLIRREYAELLQDVIH